MKRYHVRVILFFLGLILFACICPHQAPARDLEDIKKAGVIRHLGIPYANFVTGAGDGMDVEIVKLFAKHLGVRYEYVATDWPTIFGDLTGSQVKAKGHEIEVTGRSPVKGDIAANGITMLPWREKAVSFSTPVFPTQVWLVARADSPVKPIKPTGSLEKDIRLTREILKGRTILGVPGTCLDPSLYEIPSSGAKVRLFSGTLNDVAPAVIKGEAEVTILDVPDALVALQKWPGKIKVIGPISEVQEMAVAVPKESTRLLREFNIFLEKMRKDGTYIDIVKKYYPYVFRYYPAFFKGKGE
jgi:ABC-type amino acid transport substrate-binding protein